jgi:hypothetical protein
VIPAHVDDDPTIRLRAQEIGGLPRRDDRPAQVDGQEQVQLFQRRERCRRPGEDVGAGVVDPGIDPPEFPRCVHAGVPDAQRIAKRHLAHECAASERDDVAFHGARAGLVGMEGQGDVRPRTCGGKGDRAADAARRACDKHSPPAQFAGHGVKINRVEFSRDTLPENSTRLINRKGYRVTP